MSVDAERGSVGSRLKRAREYCGYSQDEVARALGLSRSAISLMESGSRGVDLIELRKLAQLYQRPIAELAGEPTNAGDAASIEVVARAARDLTPEDRKEVLQFAEFLKARRRKEQDERLQ